VLAGEVIYQIRSALDHLIFDLVQLNHSKITLPKGWDKRCDFPLFLEVPTVGNPPVPFKLPVPYSRFEGNLPGISPTAFTFIESVQPYYARDGGKQLRLLAQLSNIDKHRHLHVINPQAYVREEIVFANGSNHLSVRRTQGGTEFKPAFTLNALGTVNVQGVCHPFVSFDESALGRQASALPVDHILQLCLDCAQGIIVPAFDKFLKNP